MMIIHFPENKPYLAFMIQLFIFVQFVLFQQWTVDQSELSRILICVPYCPIQIATVSSKAMI